MRPTVDFDGSDWASAVADEFALLGLTTKAEALELADDIADRMKATAPYDESRPGGRHGRSSIGSRKGVDAEGFFVDVGPSKAAFYFAFYEFGTSRQPPRPFMRPAIESAVAAWGVGAST